MGVSTLPLIPCLCLFVGLSSGNGNIPALGPLAAQNAWIQSQLQFQANSLAFIAPSPGARSKRHVNLPVPGSPTVAWMTPEQQAEWYQVSTLSLIPCLCLSVGLSSGNGNIPALGPLAAQNAWIQSQLQFQANSLAFIAPSPGARGKRQANLPVP